MDLIDIAGAVSGNKGYILKPSDVRPSKDLIMVGSRTDSATNNNRGKWQENYITVEDLKALMAPPVPAPPTFIVIPSSVTTNIVIGNNEVGINVGGFTLDGGTVTVEGTGQIVLL